MTARCRIINFRLTDREYESVRIASEASGARCLSDFARSSILASASDDGSLQSRILRLDEKLSNLNLRLQMVLDRLK